MIRRDPHNRISRRTVLRGLGTVVALPWLEAMAGGSVSAAGFGGPTTSPPLRSAFFYVPNGMHMPDWTPSDFGSRFKLTPIIQPLEQYRSKINVLTGLTLNGARALGDGPGDHARSVAAYLTGAHPKKTGGAGIYNGPSVDQVMAHHTGSNTRLPSLEIGMEQSASAGRCDSGYSCVYSSNIAWRTATTPVAKETNPAALFDRLFGSEDDRQNREQAARRRKYRKSILDFVRDQARSLRVELGVADRQKLDEYLDSIRRVEKQIAGTDKLDEPEMDVPDYPRPKGVPRQYAEHMKLLFDVMALALETDSTRILTFMYANAGSNRSYREIGVNRGHHDLSHHGNNAEKQEQISEINQYHMKLFTYFLDKLESISEGDGSLLDNCLIVYGSGIADGNKHAHHELPIMTVGGGGRRFVTGQHLKFDAETPLTNLYLTMLDQAGAPVKSIGDSTGILDQVLRG